MDIEAGSDDACIGEYLAHYIPSIIILQGLQHIQYDQDHNVNTVNSINTT